MEIVGRSGEEKKLRRVDFRIAGIVPSRVPRSLDKGGHGTGPSGRGMIWGAGVARIRRAGTRRRCRALPPGDGNQVFFSHCLRPSTTPSDPHPQGIGGTNEPQETIRWPPKPTNQKTGTAGGHRTNRIPTLRNTRPRRQGARGEADAPAVANGTRGCGNRGVPVGPGRWGPCVPFPPVGGDQRQPACAELVSVDPPEAVDSGWAGTGGHVRGMARAGDRGPNQHYIGSATGFKRATSTPTVIFRVPP